MLAKWQIEGDLPGQFKHIYDLCVDSQDYIYVTDAHRIQKFDNNGNFICVVYEREKHSYKPAFDINGNMFLIKGTNSVEKFDCKGNFITKWRVVEYPSDIKIDSKGDVYVASSVTHRVEIPEADRSKGVYDEDGNYYVKDEIITHDSYISKFDSLGKVLHKNLYMKKNNGGVSRNSIALDSLGNFFILEGFSILMYDNKGNFIGKFGSYGFRNGCFQYPIGIEIDKENNIYVLDAIKHCIQKFSPKQ
jgi:sugar lactone lactonase YvrE